MRAKRIIQAVLKPCNLVDSEAKLIHEATRSNNIFRDISWFVNEARIKETTEGPVLALDLGQKRVGVAVSDSQLISITRLPTLARSSWKRLLHDISELSKRFDARTLVIGLPLSMDGSEGSAALEIQKTATKFARSFEMPVYLQDERLTSFEAEEQLRSAGYTAREIPRLIDGQSAAIILADFLAGSQRRIVVPRMEGGSQDSTEA